ncbi:hypothetical protein SAMN05421819_4155 [Bryocella elongata]|uniref:Carrier domain-containing protein n=1 Tax=Bryocella elongata TaxID=863522 RepID=A0A1H6C2Z2_9BACT|nr:acyl carrier protein [Bryocella elongata]SEG66746.1 hypothetical protein SAMN05421819_4155 [Bryocella elongata]
MGLDAVELVLRCEEVFAITLADDEVRDIHTVRELYALLCAKLKLIPTPNLVTPDHLPAISTITGRTLLFFHKRENLPPPAPDTWTPDLVWSYLIAIFVDQQGLDPVQVLPDAEIVRDLGID